MNNPFERFKHYRLDSSEMVDPRENHATECLAALLVFSQLCRKDFIRFLFDDHIPASVQPFLDADISVVTQEPLGKFGYADLLLSCPEHFNVMVEVKVGAHEDERHRNQLKNYRSWLSKQKPPWFLFTLVQSPDDKFQFHDFDVTQRHTWSQLYKRFKPSIALGKDDIVGILGVNFCDYLEKEGIVITWKTSELLDYEKALKAQKALRGLFGRLEEELQARKYECKFKEGNGSEWPRLEVGNKKWEEIFGGGYNNKLFVWFCVPPVWDANELGFYFEIRLWDKGHGNQWEETEPRLDSWCESLRKIGMKISVAGTWKSPDKLIKSSVEIADMPAFIKSWRDDDFINLTLCPSKGEEELVNTLVSTINEYGGYISVLSPI